MPSSFDPSGFGRRAAAITIGLVIAAGAAGTGWWQTHLATSPSCQITAPAAGTVVGSVALSATCGSTATAVSFQVNGAPVGSASSLPYSASWNSATIADGTYSLTAVAQDANGNIVTSSPVSITTSNGVGGGGGILVANEWVNVTAGASPSRCSTPCAYDSTHAYGSMQAAQTAEAAAGGGGTVVLECGSYPAQTLSSGVAAAAVTYDAQTFVQATTAFSVYAATTCATVVSLEIDISKVHVYGIQATPTPWSRADGALLTYQDVMDGGSVGELKICNSGCSTSVDTTDILVDGFRGGAAFLRASNVTIDHSSFGGFDVCYTGSAGGKPGHGQAGTPYAHITTDSISTPALYNPIEDTFRFWTGSKAGTEPPTNDILENSLIHDEWMGQNDSEVGTVCGGGSGNGPHADSYSAIGGAGVTVDSNIFWNGPDDNFQWSQFGGILFGTTPNSVLVQNNYIGVTAGQTAVIGAGTANCGGINVTNNSFSAYINESAGCTSVGLNFTNNITRVNASSCNSGAGSLAVYDHNISAAGSTSHCGTGGAASIFCAITYANPSPQLTSIVAGAGPPDPTLSGSDTCARNFSAAAFPAFDIAGNSRPLGAGADAGPSEVS